MGLRLVVIEGPGKGRQLRLEERPVFQVGSSGEAELRLDDPAVAPVHLKLYREGDAYQCLDVSGRGFRLLGPREAREETRARLAVGAAIAVGGHTLRLISDAAAPQARLDPAALPGNGQGPALVAVEGNDVGARYPLGDKAQIVGRGATTDITIWDVRASRAHARIAKRGDGYEVADLNSSNGTLLNGDPLDMTPRPLSPGDRIRIGATVLQFTA